MADTRTVVIADAACLRADCCWHATGTDVARVERAIAAHERNGRHVTEDATFPLTCPVDQTVDFHSCTAFDHDRADTPGRACTTTEEDAA